MTLGCPERAGAAVVVTKREFLGMFAVLSIVEPEPGIPEKWIPER
jgi:hypothetical protein